MSLDVTKQIPPLSLAQNPIKIYATTDNLYTVTGVKTLGVYQLGTFAVGESLTLTWDDEDGESHSITYNCTSVSEIEGTNFPAGAFPYEKYFACNYELALTFDYVFENNQHKFTAKKADADVTISVTGDNVSSVAGVSGVDPVKRDMFILCDIYQQTSSGITYIATDRLRPDSNGNVIFNIAEYVEGMFDDYLPDFDGDQLALMQGAVVKFKFRLWEYYDDTKYNEYDGSYFNDDLLPYDYAAINGGVSNEQFEIWEEANTNFYEQNIVAKEFITSQPRSKDIDLIQKEFLYFYFFNEAATQIRYYIDVTFTDGTSVTANPFTEASPEQYNIYQLLTGFEDSQAQYAESVNGKTTKYYEVYLEDQSGNEISERFRFYPNRKYYKVRNEFVFRNHLGMFDTVWFHGKEEFSTEYTREFFEKLEKLIQRKPDMKTEYTVNSGFISRDYKEYLQDFFGSTEIYEGFFNDQAERYYRKILALSDNISPVQNSDVYREQATFTYRFDSEENIFTKFRFPLWILEEGDWNDNGFWLDYKLWNDN